MENFKGEKIYPGLNARVYRVERQPTTGVPKKLPMLGDNSGVLHRFGFMVNREISLVGVEFLGPSEVSVGKYRAEVAVSRTEEDWGWRSCLIYCSHKPMYRVVDLQPYHVENVEAEKGQNFIVSFAQPVVVTPNLWTDVKFQLDGPATNFMEFSGSKQDVFVDGLGAFTFDFLRGSKQLVALHFIV